MSNVEFRDDQNVGEVVSKATTRAADRLAVSNVVLSRILGLSEASISRMRNNEYVLRPGQKDFELGILFVRLFRSLDAIVGGDEAVARAWMINENSVLAARPVDSIQSVAGLVEVIAYLDARRAIV